MDEKKVDGRKTSWTPERRARQAAIKRKEWADPARHARMVQSCSETIRRKWQDPEYRARAIAGIRRRFEKVRSEEA